ncbi:MAG TPA: thioredoxin domain-containing protein [bacterium]
MSPNALLHEASPYLRQHAQNPVNWLPWGDAAFEQAARENRPVFLSIGYAACHWCHVMAHESFQDADIARALNENFVCIKVDREERPDVDHYYMQAVQGLTGQGGWPLSGFLTPDKKLFFGGTYWPPRAKWGKPGFQDVIEAVAQSWRDRPGDLMAGANELHAALGDLSVIHSTGEPLSADLLEKAVRDAEATFDPVHGGFGPAPKFPHALQLSLLLRIAAQAGHKRAREMVMHTLRQMARGGIYDQIGGGFHRYSTDGHWLVPHFEKMLYDNALLSPVYLNAGVLTGDAELFRIGRETLDWALREMTVERGGFASSLDADSEGEEGAFYVWTPSEVEGVLGAERGRRFCRIYDIAAPGNFERERSIPNLTRPVADWADDFEIPAAQLEGEIAEDRQVLQHARNLRVRPERDDKVLTDWNGLMITALVRGFAVLNETRYLDAAQTTADRLLGAFENRQTLAHSQLEDRSKEISLLLDYATLAAGLLDLYLATGTERWFDGAVALASRLDELFANPQGPYVMSAQGVAGDPFPDPYDNVLPAGSSVAGTLAARLYYLTGNNVYMQRAVAQTQPLAALMRATPAAFSAALVTASLLQSPPAQLVLVGDHQRELWRAAQSVFVPTLDCLWLNESDRQPKDLSALLEGKVTPGGKPTAYLCRHFSCSLPVHSGGELKAQLVDIQQSKTAL